MGRCWRLPEARPDAASPPDALSSSSTLSSPRGLVSLRSATGVVFFSSRSGFEDILISFAGGQRSARLLSAFAGIADQAKVAALAGRQPGRAHTAAHLVEVTVSDLTARLRGLAAARRGFLVADVLRRH